MGGAAIAPSIPHESNLRDASVERQEGIVPIVFAPPNAVTRVMRTFGAWKSRRLKMKGRSKRIEHMYCQLTMPLSLAVAENQ